MKAKRSIAKVSNSGKLLALLFVGLFFLSLVPVASASEWSYQKAITIDHEKVVADLADFPVLISMVDTELIDKAQSDGDDILFVNAANTIRLDHEIEYFNGSTGELHAWVRIPSLSATTNTTIYMYYGNLTCENQQNAADVWDSNYRMVQHLHEISKTAGYYNDHLDSTSNNNDGEAYITPETNMDATGQINGANKFDGGDDYVAVSDNKNINFGPNQDFSLAAWIKAKPDQARCQGTILAKMNSPDDNPKRAYGYSLMVRGVTDTTNKGKIGVWLGDGVGGGYSVFKLYSNATYNDNNWHHVVATLDRDGLAKLYIDGYETNSTDISHLSSIDESYPENLEIGREGVFDTYRFNGIIDEVRISAIARSGNWINTCYCNQNGTLTFYTVGLREDDPAPPAPLPAFILSTDTDGDGVPDVWDVDNSTPAGYGVNPQGIGRKWGDMNGDGKLTSVDALMILQAAAGSISLRGVVSEVRA